MPNSLVTRWRSSRAKRREEMLERLGWEIERGAGRGGSPTAGGFGGVILVAVTVAVFVAWVVALVLIERSGLR